MKKLPWIALLLVLLATSLFYFNQKSGKIDENYQVTLLNGKKVKFAELRGKPLVVVFWATSCSGCMQELPQLDKYIKEKNTFNVLAVAMNYDERTLIDNYIAKNKYPFLVTHDIDNKISEQFGGIKFTPTTIVISKNGEVITKIIGNDINKILLNI